MNQVDPLKLISFRVRRKTFYFAACAFYSLKLKNQKHFKIDKHLQK